MAVTLIGTREPELIGFSDLLNDAWRLKWQLGSVISLCMILGAVAGYLIPKEYRAEILVSPVTESPTGSGGLGGLASQYGDLASMAGISVSGKANNKAESIAVLQSALITEGYIKRNDLLPVLYWKVWDASNHKWKVSDPKRIPTLWKANEYFKKKIREVKEDRQSGLVTLRISWRDPVEAARWANEIVGDTNRYMREKAIRESEKNIEYLNEQAAKTNVLEARSAIFAILKEEINKEMIAKGREEYALKIIDPAEVPEQPSSPSIITMTIVGTIVGLIFSALLILGRRLSS